jgi:putative hydrolase of the HAD superfamily
VTNQKHTYVFDLDHTLYYQTAEMTAYFADVYESAVAEVLSMDIEQARHITLELLTKQGDAISNIDQGIHAEKLHKHVEQTLDEKVDYTLLKENPEQAWLIRQLEGRKIVFSNGTLAHIGHALPRLGLTNTFEKTYGIGCVGFKAKPKLEGFAHIAEDAQFSLEQATFIDDSIKNLVAAKKAGFGRTAMITWGNEPQTHIPEIDEYHDDALEFCKSELKKGE